MVHLKSTEEHKQEALTVEYYRLKSKNIWGLIFISVLIHGLGLLLLVKMQANQSTLGKQTATKPVDFVVVPTPEPKLESSQPEPEIPDESIRENTEPEPVEEVTPPTPQPTPQPEAITPPTPPQPVEPIEPQAIEPEPAVEQSPVLSGSDSTSVVAPEPTPTPKPEPVEEVTPKPQPQEPIATSLPPEQPSQSIPESIAPKASPETLQDNNQDGGAASLLGGEYKKTYADSGAQTFFSPEALSYEAVLDPEQLKALQGFDLEAYQRGLYNKVKRNWRPSFREKYTTWLSFNIEKSGQISQLQVVESSGSAEFDRVAVEAVQNAVPLDPLPADFPLEHLKFKYQFYLY